LGAARAPEDRASQVTRLRLLASHMRHAGLAMFHVSPFGSWELHGHQLLGAAEIAESWACEMEACP